MFEWKRTEAEDSQRTKTINDAVKKRFWGLRLTDANGAALLVI
jgi:hypothetical protein